MSSTDQLRFDPEAHHYYLNDKRIPSVSEVLEPLQELDGIPRHVLEAAREVGVAVHHAIALDLQKNLNWPKLDPKLANYVLAARKFVQECDFKVLVVEKHMADPGLKFGGTLDTAGIFRRANAIVDWKVTAAMPRTAGPQTAAYDYLYRRTLGGRPYKRYGVQLFDDCSYKIFPFEDSRDWSWFASCLNIWHWRNQR